MEQQHPLPCVRCLKVHSRGQFSSIPIQCIHSNSGPCQYCRDAEKPCIKIPEPLINTATFLQGLLHLATLENPTDQCPALHEDIRLARRDFTRLLSLELEHNSHPFREPEEETGAGEIWEHMPAQEDWNREEHYEETLELIQQILPSLDTISRHFAEASEVMQRMNRRLAMAISPDRTPRGSDDA